MNAETIRFRLPNAPRLETRCVSPLLATAYHEAGHALLMCEAHFGIRSVDILKTGDRLGTAIHARFRSSFKPDVEVSTTTRLRLEGIIRSSLAGLIAEKLAIGRYALKTACSDLDAVDQAITWLASDMDEQVAQFSLLAIQTRNALVQDWPKSKRHERASSMENTLMYLLQTRSLPMYSLWNQARRYLVVRPRLEISADI